MPPSKKIIETSAFKILVNDDAPQFKLITETLSLCWVHVARNIKANSN